MASLSAYYPLPVVAGTTAGTYAEGNDPRFGDGLEEAPEDGVIYGRKDADWVDITEPANLQVRRGTASEVAAITPLEGEPVWKTDAKRLVVGDGSTAGGITVGGFPVDGTFRTAVNPNAPQAGSVFVGAETENLGGSGQGRPFVTGNARGAGAVDLQTQRSIATQVASGNYSAIIGGFSNTASGLESIVLASRTCTSSGTKSFVLSSNNSTASGASSMLIAGNNNTVSGSSAFGVGSDISNAASVAFYGTSERPYSFVFGSQALFPNILTQKRNQFALFILKTRTTSNSPTEMTISGNTRLTIPENVAFFGQAEICAIEETTGAEAVHYTRKFAIKNVGGTTTLIGSVTTIGTDYESDAGFDIAITADDTLDCAKFEATAINSNPTRWVATVSGIEVEIT
jgi:hypothetical protein